jgi:hypothetical protein
LRIAWFFLDHCIDNVFPLVKTVAMLDGICNNAMLCLPAGTASFFGLVVGFRVDAQVNPMWLEQGMLVT